MCLSRLEQMVTHHEDGWIVVCIFVFPPASPELTVTTAVIKGLTVNATRGGQEDPLPVQCEEK